MALSERELIEQFRPDAVNLDGELYLEVQRALEFVWACDRNDLAVIGIDGAVIREGAVKPHPDVVADYSSFPTTTSWEDYRVACNQSATDLLRDLADRKGLIIHCRVLAAAEWFPPLR